MRLLTLFLLLVVAVCAHAQSRRVLALVDSSQFPALQSRLARWQADVKKEGFAVTLRPMPASAPKEEVKALIRKWYRQSPQARNHLFLVGHLAVPLAWQQGPDGHGWFGAAPADAWYADMDAEWGTEKRRTRTENNRWELVTAYDGYRRVYTTEIAVARIDYYPVAPEPEEQGKLLAAYFDRNHAYRTGQWKAEGDVLCTHDNARWFREARQRLEGIWQPPGADAVKVSAGEVPLGMEIEWKVCTNPKKPTPPKKRSYRLGYHTPGANYQVAKRASCAFWVRYISFCWNPQEKDALHVRILRDDPGCVGIAWGWNTLDLKSFLQGGKTWGECRKGAVFPPALTPLGDPTLTME